jgi:Fe-S-cluster containining protein
MKKKLDIRNLPPPRTPATALAVEKRIIARVRALIGKYRGSCLDKGFLDSWDRVLSLFDGYQSEVLRRYPLAVTCSDNCGVCCCHWPEDTYSFEVHRIASHLRKRRKSELNRIVSTLKADIDFLARIKTAVRQKLANSAAKKALGTADPYDLALSSFYEFERPCPLLDKNGSCSIYPIRPLTCRVYVSFSDKALCGPGRIRGDDALTCLLDMDRDASGLFDRLSFMYDVFDGDTSFRSMLYKALKSY